MRRGLCERVSRARAHTNERGDYEMALATLALALLLGLGLVIIVVIIVVIFIIVLIVIVIVIRIIVVIGVIIIRVVVIIGIVIVILILVIVDIILIILDVVVLLVLVCLEREVLQDRILWLAFVHLLADDGTNLLVVLLDQLEEFLQRHVLGRLRDPDRLQHLSDLPADMRRDVVKDVDTVVLRLLAVVRATQRQDQVQDVAVASRLDGRLRVELETVLPTGRRLEFLATLPVVLVQDDDVALSALVLLGHCNRSPKMKTTWTCASWTSHPDRCESSRSDPSRQCSCPGHSGSSALRA